MLEDTTNLPNLAAWLVVLTAAAAGAVTDARERRLPNALTAPLFISGLVFAGMAGGVAGFGDSLLASMLLAAPYLVLFAVAAGGAGDAKMMAAVGAWLGVWHGLIALACVALAGGVMALAIAAATGRFLLVTANLVRAASGAAALAHGQIRSSELSMLGPKPSEMHRFPYGVAIFAGVAIAFAGVQLWHV